MSEPFWTPLGGQPVDYEGAYNPATQYAPGDVVRYQGVDYLAVNPSLGTTPPAVGGPGAARIVTADANLVTITNTAVETDLFNYTVLAGTLKNPGQLRLYLAGDNIYNANVAFALRVYLGATLCLHAEYNSGTVAGNRQPWEAFLRVTPLGALNSILPLIRLDTIQPDGSPLATVGIGAIANRLDFLIQGGLIGPPGGDPVAVDFSVDQAVRVTAKYASASASVTWRKRAAILEAIG